jgi:hypothetical protein
MCTSFVVNSEQTVIGMNFDISRRPIKFVLHNDNQLFILQSEDGQFLPAFGMNKSGTFMNLLMVEPNDEGKYRRGKNCVHVMRLFDEVLSEKIQLPLLPDYLNMNTVVNVPNYSVQSMIAGIDRHSYIVEPGKKNLDLNAIDSDFMVLTNFSLSSHTDDAFEQVSKPGNERYKKAYDSIVRDKETFNSDKGFSVLKATAQHGGEYPTQLSMISMPEESLIYFTLNGDFDKIYEFSFVNNQIRTSIGFVNDKNYTLTKKGILLTELETWQ